MNITVLGTGYVGLVSGVCFADLGNQVHCVDRDEAKIAKLNLGQSPIYEPGLEQLIRNNREAGRLSFVTDLTTPVQTAELIIIAVGTPQSPSGEADLQFIEQAARDIAMSMNGYKIIAVKSTVPVGTNDRVRAIIRALTVHPFDIVSIPEFLREGSAIQDTFHPDRMVIGSDNERAAERVAALHDPMHTKIVMTDIRSAEMIKYASNAFLATKISFINEIANICDKVGANIEQVAKGMGMDRRIGEAFLQAGIGYGGSCFPKDTQALIQIAGNVEYDFKLLRSVVDVNHAQRYNIFNKLLTVLNGLEGKTIGVWGLAFKPNTDDVRDAPSLEIVPMLLASGARVKVYDPVAMDRFAESVADDSLHRCSNAYEAAEDADALCLLTEWEEFGIADLKQVERSMRQPILIDGRNVFTQEQLEQTGFAYYSVGRPSMNRSPRSVQEEVLRVIG